MIDLSFREKIARMENAYQALRHSIYWDRDLARMEWDRDCRRYPLRGYFKKRMTDNIKAAWYLRNIVRDLRNPVLDTDTIRRRLGLF